MNKKGAIYIIEGENMEKYQVEMILIFMGFAEGSKAQRQQARGIWQKFVYCYLLTYF